MWWVPLCSPPAILSDSEADALPHLWLNPFLTCLSYTQTSWQMFQTDSTRGRQEQESLREKVSSRDEDVLAKDPAGL